MSLPMECAAGLLSSRYPSLNSLPAKRGDYSGRRWWLEKTPKKKRKPIAQIEEHPTFDFRVKLLCHREIEDSWELDQ